MNGGVSALEQHVNGDCWPDTCTFCSREDSDLCEECDGQGEVENIHGLIERCNACLGTGRAEP